MAEVEVLVEAEDEDDQTYKFNCKVPASVPLASTLQKKWAAAYNVPQTAVGFEDDQETEVDLRRTPEQLCWGPSVHLFAVPIDKNWVEGAGGEAELAAGPAAPASKVFEVPSATPAPAAPDPAAPAPAATAAAPAASAKVPPSPMPEEVKAMASAKMAPMLETADQVQAAPAPPPTAAAEEAPALQAAAAPEAAAVPRPAAASEAAAAQKKAAKRPRLAEPSSAAAPAGDAPTGDEPIKFDEVNPKKRGGAAYERYERYKTAKTPQEALRLGAAKGDIINDFKKGYLKRA